MPHGDTLVAETGVVEFFSFLINLTIIELFDLLRKKRLFSSFGRTV